MRNGGGKQKGAQFEREVCVTLSKWLTNNVQMDVFWRSAMSGGRATVTRQRHKIHLQSQVGDISAIDPMGSMFLKKFVVECKHLKDLELNAAIKSGSGSLPKIWSKLNTDAYAHHKDGFLVMKQNNWPILLGIHPSVRISMNFVYQELMPICTLPRIDLNIYFFSDWVEHIDPKWFHPNVSILRRSSPN